MLRRTMICWLTGVANLPLFGAGAGEPDGDAPLVCPDGLAYKRLRSGKPFRLN